MQKILSAVYAIALISSSVVVGLNSPNPLIAVLNQTAVGLFISIPYVIISFKLMNRDISKETIR